MNKISVIVPIYNTKEYLPKCIESICCQTYKCLEIILVDDGSTDGSGDICDYYAKMDIRINVIHKKNEGAAAARKTGVAYATGEFTAFVDSDDWIENDMYEKMVCMSKNGMVDIICCGFCVVSNKGKRVEVNCIDEGIYEKDKMPYIYKNMMFDENFSSPSIIQSACTKLIRTSILKKCISYVDNCITYGDDAAIVYRCILNSDSIAILNKGLYDYNRLPEQTMCTSEDINRFTGIQVFYKSMHQYFKDYDAEYNLQSQLNNYVVHLIEMALRNNLGFRGISSGNCIPFNAFTNAKNIALYGAGKIGKEYYNQLMSCETIHVTTWVDKNLAGECIMGRQIDPLDKLKENDYDLCLIAVAKEEMADEIRNEIIHYTDEKKIVWQKPVRAKSKLIFDLD